MNFSKSIHSIGKYDTLHIVSLMTWVQVLCTAVMLLTPTLATYISISLGVSAGLVGVQVSFFYSIAMLSSLKSSYLVHRFGGCRASQLSIFFVVVGCMMALLDSVYWMLIFTIFIGLAYGINGPAAADLLTRFTPSNKKNLIFSIKQAGVPLGGVLVSIVGPILASLWGWKSAFAVVGGVCLLTLLALQYRRNYWDSGHRQLSYKKKHYTPSLFHKNSPFFWLGATGFFMSSVQICLLSFSILYMVDSLEISPVSAGLIASLMHFSGVASRIGWGVAADVIGSSMLVLLFLAGSSFIFFIILAFAGSSTPTWFPIVLLVTSGVSALGWNGVYLAEAARRSDLNNASESTAIALIFTFFGALSAPSLFALALWYFDSYSVPFFLVSINAALAFFCIWRCWRSESANIVGT
mgnify:FL=1|tara:strand:- start:1109 stop:2335 length:1227 start_codon:yes stop_codon:yes gene_type:complete